MNIAIVDGDSVLAIGPYKELFPNTSFSSSGPSDEFLAEASALRVNLWKPYDQFTEKLVPCEPYVEEEWVYTVSVEALSEEEQQARINSQWSKVRSQRNSLLLACDWTQLSDSPADKEAWAIYRQELRDVTSQLDPFNIEWPKDPDFVEQLPVA